MRLTKAVQEALLSILCYDDQNASLIAQLTPPTVFDPFYADFAQQASDYRESYGTVPGEHTLDIAETLKARDPDHAEIYGSLFESVTSTKDDINPDFIIKQAATFTRFQKLKSGVASAARALKRGDEASVLEAESALTSSLERSLEIFDPGTFLQDTARSLAFLRDDYQPFRCGIPEIDKYGLGPARKRLHVLLALTGRGKSWWLVHLAKQGILQRLKVCYVTLELSEAEVSQRIFQSLFAITKRKESVDRVKFEQDELGRFVGYDTITLKNRPYLQDPNVGSQIIDKLSGFKNKIQLVIREFPAGELTPGLLEAYLDSLEASQKFVPDLLLVDYIDEMAPDTAYHEVRHGLKSITTRLRGIGMKRNIAVASVSQSNREGVNAKTLNESHMAEAFSKVGVADALFTYSQTEMEKAYGLARLFVAKGRTDADKFTVLISQAYAIGAFCLDSARMVSSYFRTLEESSEDED